MPAHQFALGQTVRLRSPSNFSIEPHASFRITGKLPERNNSPQYRMRSDAERHDRMMSEADLEPVDMPMTANDMVVSR